MACVEHGLGIVVFQPKATSSFHKVTPKQVRPRGLHKFKIQGFPFTKEPWTKEKQPDKKKNTTQI